MYKFLTFDAGTKTKLLNSKKKILLLSLNENHWLFFTFHLTVFILINSTWQSEITLVNEDHFGSEIHLLNEIKAWC